MILLVIVLVVIYISFAIAHVFGESERECVNYKTNHLLMISTVGDNNGCNWLVDKLLWNSSGFHVSGYAESLGAHDVSFQTFVLTK